MSGCEKVLVCLLIIASDLSVAYADTPPSHWEQLRKDGLKALLEDENCFEASNKLKGALIEAMKGKPGNPQEKQSREDLLLLFQREEWQREDLMDLHQRLKRDLPLAKSFKKLSRDELLTRLKKDYDPNVWYTSTGGANNNAVPKGKILGEASMLSDKRVRVDLQYWTKAGEMVSTAIYAPDHPHYQFVLDEVGGLKPGETKPVLAPYPSKPWPHIPGEKGKAPPLDGPPHRWR